MYVYDAVLADQTGQALPNATHATFHTDSLFGAASAYAARILDGHLAHVEIAAERVMVGTGVATVTPDHGSPVRVLVTQTGTSW